MEMKDKLWAIYDPKDSSGKKGGCIKVNSVRQARELNSKYYAIYWTPNDFNGERREENLTKINYYFCDIDGGNKEEQWERIQNVVTPSVVVESKNGYHCYWEVSDATVEGFKKIEKGIVKRLKADPHVTDLPRLLRVPSFYHYKNPDDPFLVRTVLKTGRVFTEDFMLFHFQLPPEPKIEYNFEGKDKDYFLNPDNWERIFKLSHIQEGGRNSMLKDQVYKAYMNGIRGNELRELSLALNSRLSSPLPQYEVINMMRGLK